MCGGWRPCSGGGWDGHVGGGPTGGNVVSLPRQRQGQVRRPRVILSCRGPSPTSPPPPPSHRRHEKATLPPVRPSVRSSAPPAVLLIKVFFFSPGRRLSLCVLLFAGERTNERAERMCVCVCGGQGVKEGYRRGRRAEGGNEIIRRFDEVRRLLLTDSRRIC